MAKSTSLSLLAKSAKARLKCNSYIGVQSMPKQTNFRDYIEKSTEDKNRKNTVQSVVVNTYDEILYKRVCEIIDKGLDKVNPINELIDKKIFYGLDFEAKQHYISTLNFKYKELKQRYYRERMASYSFG